MWWFFGIYSSLLNYIVFFSLFHLLCVALSRFVLCTMLFVSTSQSWSTLNLFIKSAFASCVLYHVYILEVVDIAMSAKIESKSFLHRSPFILFTLSTLLISQWWPTSILHSIYIVSITYYLNWRHRNVDQHRDVIGLTYYPFYLVYIVNIAMLITNELKLYLHFVPSILFISSTSRCWPTFSRHCICIHAPWFFLCIYRLHRNVGQHRVNIVFRFDVHVWRPKG